MSELLNIALIAALIIQALFYQFTIHRLINKLMAKSLSEYTSTIDRVALEEINLKKQQLESNFYGHQEMVEQNQGAAILNSMIR
jgi:ribosomal protein S7